MLGYSSVAPITSHIQGVRGTTWGRGAAYVVSKTEPGEDGQVQGHDPGSRQDEGKRETRAQVRVRERKCDTPSRPRKGVKEDLRAGRMYGGWRYICGWREAGWGHHLSTRACHDPCWSGKQPPSSSSLATMLGDDENLGGHRQWKPHSITREDVQHGHLLTAGQTAMYSMRSSPSCWPPQLPLLSCFIS